MHHLCARPTNDIDAFECQQFCELHCTAHVDASAEWLRGCCAECMLQCAAGVAGRGFYVKCTVTLLLVGALGAVLYHAYAHWHTMRRERAVRSHKLHY